MKKNFDTCLAHVLAHEGGFCNHPQDPGGATNKGVTLAVFRRHYGASMGIEELKAITKEQLRHIYKTGYWDKCHCDDLPGGLDYVVFDQAVNSGPGRSARWLQAVLGVKVDGKIGAKTLAAAREVELPAAVTKLCDNRLAWLRRLKTWPTFGKGWTRRVEGVRKYGLELCGGAAPEAAPSASEVKPSVDYEVVREGSSGPWVERLQAALGVKVDGKFGPKTRSALEAFQAAEELTVDGVAGRNTYRALGLIE